VSNHHTYELSIQWTGNNGTGTANYRAYERSYTVSVAGKVEIAGSSDPAFRGDKTKYNPEELFVASLSSCHMLFFLHLCADEGVVVLSYTDHATGLMEESSSGAGHFSKVTLKPLVVVAEQQMADKTGELHRKANKLCFIANSVNFKIEHHPVCEVRESNQTTDPR
jgi:organic hydroperoxide reductase OsmC/OhrA